MPRGPAEDESSEDDGDGAKSLSRTVLALAAHRRRLPLRLAWLTAAVSRGPLSVTPPAAGFRRAAARPASSRRLATCALATFAAASLRRRRRRRGRGRRGTYVELFLAAEARRLDRLDPRRWDRLDPSRLDRLDEARRLDRLGPQRLDRLDRFMLNANNSVRSHN